MVDKLEADGAELKKRMRIWLTNWFGERCSDFFAGCECCEAWKGFDVQFEHIED